MRTGRGENIFFQIQAMYTFTKKPQVDCRGLIVPEPLGSLQARYSGREIANLVGARMIRVKIKAQIFCQTGVQSEV